MDEQNTNLESEAPAREPVSTEATANEPAPAQNTETAPVEEASSKKKLYVAVAIVAALLTLGGYYFYTAKMADGGPVAVVNGFKIARDEFNSSVEMIKQTASLQGANVEDPEVQTTINNQALDILVNNALLLEGAKASGITADDARVQSEYDALVAQVGGAEVLATRMAEVDLTEEELRGNIAERIIVDAYLEAETDVESVSATEEEIDAFMESLTASGNELPPEDVLRPQVEQEILNQKRQTIVNGFLMKLRESAEIEIKI